MSVYWLLTPDRLFEFEPTSWLFSAIVLAPTNPFQDRESVCVRETVRRRARKAQRSLLHVCRETLSLLSALSTDALTPDPVTFIFTQDRTLTLFHSNCRGERDGSERSRCKSSEGRHGRFRYRRLEYGQTSCRVCCERSVRAFCLPVIR